MVTGFFVLDEDADKRVSQKRNRYASQETLGEPHLNINVIGRMSNCLQ